MPKLSRRAIDAAAWDVFARHQPYYHILSHPSMLSPGPERQEEFWASGISDIQSLQAFAGLQFGPGTGVDLGCGLGRLTRAMRLLTTHQIATIRWRGYLIQWARRSWTNLGGLQTNGA